MPSIVAEDDGKAQEQLACEVVAAEAAEGTDDIFTNTAGNGVHESMQTDCCMQKMLASQQNFMNEKPLIWIIIEEAAIYAGSCPSFIVS